MTLVYKLVLRLIYKEKLHDLDGINQTHNLHNSGVTALPVELPSPGEQGGGSYTARYLYTGPLGAYSGMVNNSSRLSYYFLCMQFALQALQPLLFHA